MDSNFRFLVRSTPPDALPTGPPLPRPTCWIQFAVDSLLEGDGFESPVPHQIRSRFRESSHFSHDGLTVSRPGTGSSNPSPSSGESSANLRVARRVAEQSGITTTP